MRDNIKIEKLTKAELEFMEYIWCDASKKTLQDFVEYFAGRRWERSTVSSYLHRLYQKGFLTYEKSGRYYYYEPTITKIEYEQYQIDRLMKQIYGLPFEGVLAAFLGKTHLSKTQLDRIRGFLNELEDEQDKD